MKYGKIKSVGHILCIGDSRNTYTILARKHEVESRFKQEDNSIIDHKGTEWTGLIG